jgi:hypothetical protein
MRKLVSAVLLLGLVAGISARSFAFTSLTQYVKGASVQFAAGTINSSLVLKNLGDNNTTNQIFWNTAAINLGSTEWRRADAYMFLSTTMTDTNGAVQIYTDNKNAAANPRFTGPGSVDCSGLIDASSTTVAGLKMAWRATDVSTNTLTIQHTADFANLFVSELSATNYVFSYLNDPGFGLPMGDSYAQVKNYAQGNHLASGGTGQIWSFAANVRDTYLYLGANFLTAQNSHTYGTNRIIVETYLQ